MKDIVMATAARAGQAMVLVFLLIAGAAQAQQLPGGFVYLRDIDPSIIQDMRFQVGQRH